ncbi:hypothetical protein HID58_014397 [Brassica napus]|uniref:Uncharacterized protein n=1 Tax=Brassica napus TaxID=3708 RepID=A0ABQ8DH11_BRANA|nr:hypothetical protein HID58_014397 [Brassica napus]
MFGVPSRSQTDKTMIDVAKSKDSQEQHEPVKANTCDCSPVSILKPLTPPETPNKESPTIGSSFVQDKLHPGAAMTTEVIGCLSFLFPLKELVSPLRKDSLTEREDNHICAGCTEPGARRNTPPEDDGNKTTQNSKLPEGKENYSETIALGSKFGGQVSYGGEHKEGMNCGRMINVSENKTVRVVNSNEGEDGSFFTFRTVSATCKAHCKACSTDNTSR